VFDLDPIIWLQSWSSPALTAVMNGISLLGYTRAYVAFATLLVFAFRQRAAIALLVLIGLNGALTDIAKTAAARRCRCTPSDSGTATPTRRQRPRIRTGFHRDT
jgi:hypothetical protein